MSQPGDRSVIFADGPDAADAALLAKGQRVLVEAEVDQFYLGDSCVCIITGDKLHRSHFWVPTRSIRRPLSGLKLELEGAIPDYTVLDALNGKVPGAWIFRPAR